jgi:hypothetical protein
MRNSEMWFFHAFLLAIFFGSATAANCQAGGATSATYFVDSAKGSDANSGATSAAPWKTLGKVNATLFQPGDRILFKSGSVWQGQLAPKSSGAEKAPIIFDRYGEGPKPKIDGGGQVEDVIRLYNVQQIEVRNFEVANHGAQPALRRGVHIFLENYGTCRHIVISGLYIHDVNGTNGVAHSQKDNGGIVFRTVGNKVPSRFDGLILERNIVWKVDRSAIVADSYHAPRTRWFPSLNVVIRDNYVEDIGGDGIVPWATDGVLVEHNIARDCNRRAGSYNAGIWPWSTDNSLFQLNEACFTRTTLDGEGFDSDYNSRQTLFQYNYSHDNEGGFLLICTPGKRNQQENLGNLGTEARFNISRNDRTRIFHLVGAATQTSVHDNAVYVGLDLDVQLLVVTDWDGWADAAVFRDNLFQVEGTARYGHEVKRNQGLYEIGPGWGPASGLVFEGNRYIGRHIDRPEDPKGIVAETAKTPAMDWDTPRFDPAKPEDFDAFLAKHRQWMLRLFERQFGKPVKLGR